MDEIELEVFRAGTASRGITAEDLAELATGFTGANPCPVVIGHPKSNDPAHGEVAAFRADGNSLFARIKNLGQAVVEGVKNGTILNRSMKFFPKNHSSNPTPGKLAPWHLGFLGASAPGIPNMPRIDKALAFDAEGDTFTIEAEPAPAVMAVEEDDGSTAVIEVTEPKREFEAMAVEPTKKPATQAEIDAEAERLATERSTFQAERRASYEADNEARVDALIAGGKLLPADKDRTLLVFNALEPEALEFEAGKPKRSPASELAALLGGAVKLVPVDEKRESPSTEFKAEIGAGDSATVAAGKIDAAARKLMEADSSLSFEAAVERVSQTKEG